MHENTQVSQNQNLVTAELSHIKPGLCVPVHDVNTEVKIKTRITKDKKGIYENHRTFIYLKQKSRAVCAKLSKECKKNKNGNVSALWHKDML